MRLTEGGGAAVVALEGEIDMAIAERIGAQLLERIGKESTRVVIDLSDVSYLDSAGIQMLFDVVRQMHTGRQAVAVAVPADSPLSGLLRVTGVDEACPVAPSVAECVVALAAGPDPY